MHETWRLHGRGRVKRWKRFILPAIFPSLLVGWETAMGGAWNASILTEYFRLNDTVHTAYGLGAVINLATVQGDFAMLAGAVLVMVLIVVGINRLVWHRLYDVASRMTGG
jgi:NitT/TauT family transport system permease protein